MRLRSLLFSLALLPVLAWAKAPDVVVTLGPIHSLVAGVMQGVAEPKLLLPAGASPHSYALLPSDARALSGAELVVWVSPELERFLQKPLKTVAAHAGTLEIASLPGLTLLEGREAGHGEHDGHAPGDADLHLWLDPHNARVIVKAAAERLADLDPANAARYRQNAQTLQARLGELDQRTRRALAPLKDKPYVVFHDAYHYFEHRYDLHSAATVTVSPERPPGARQVAEIREKIRTAGVKCVFREPQFESSLVQALVRGTSARVGVLDPVGATLEPGPEAYFQLIDGLTGSLVGCLGQ